MDIRKMVLKNMIFQGIYRVVAGVSAQISAHKRAACVLALAAMIWLPLAVDRGGPAAAAEGADVAFAMVANWATVCC